MNQLPMNMRPLSVFVSATVLLAGWLASPSQAQVDPTGDWDFTISGKARGIAQVTFNSDGTITGVAHLQTLRKAPDLDPRGTGDRSGESSSATLFTNFFGSAGIDGVWTMTPSGRVIGFLNEGSVTLSATATNVSTNSVSFHAVVRGGSA